MTTCTNHLPPLVICLTTLHIYMWRTYKYTPLLGPNVSLIGAQKVALPQQLEKIGTICSLRRIADISSRISDLRDVCWEIKRVPRRAEVTVLCWNWPEVCPGPGAADATILLRLHALSTQSWLEVTLWNLSAVRIIFNRLKESGIWMHCEGRWEGQSYMFIYELVIENAFSEISLMIDDIFPFPLQNNGSLVWCQNHKQCSKVVWFHFFHE